MTPNMLKIANWEKWQSYRSDRSAPPWIKVYRRLMQNYEWLSLTDAQKGQLVSLWLLAADRNGEIPSSPKILRKVLSLDSEPDVQLFMNHGFIVGDVTVTPERRHDDAPEESRVEEKRKELLSDSGKKPRKVSIEETPEFQSFYSLYPKHVGRGKAFKAWKAAVKKVSIDHIMEALRKQIRAGVFRKDDPQFIPHPSSWLNGQCWDDDVPFTPAAPDTRPTKFRVQPIIDPETGEELAPVRSMEYKTHDEMEAAMKAMQIDRKHETAGYWLFTEAGYKQQVESLKRAHGIFGAGLVRKI